MIVSAPSLIEMKRAGHRISALTAYDFPTAKLLDEAGIDLLLVGDSLGMVVLGMPDTTEVTLADIIHHTRPVARAAQRALVVADLPFGSYDSPEMAMESARQLIEAGAKAVKLEGAHIAEIYALTRHGIPTIAHLGMLPQHVREEGGYKIKGKSEADAARLLEEALAVEKAGASAIVLELIVPDVARLISQAVAIPTIGIGAGKECDGQILVTHDLIGFFPWFTPKFATVRADVAGQISQAARDFLAALAEEK
ncbi:MAG: 3-methyl-2-oxobutanoate hydroxymethyltransferase [Chthoniobacterales bacterium]